MRLPIRVRLTAAFALAMVLVLAAAAAFIYVRLRADLDEAVTAQLQARAKALAVPAGGNRAALRDTATVPPGEGDEAFAQIVSGDARVLDSAGGARRSALTRSQAGRAAQGALLIERDIPGIDGTARVLARPITHRGRAALLAVGQSLEDRDETLSGLVASFAIGGPAAVLLASGLGYMLATAGLAPVEAMRRRASQVSLARGHERLPLPVAHDEVRRLGETLNEMLERLERAFERERRFVADASHEMRTPVAVVKTELEGALRTGDYGPQVREALVAAVEECDHLGQLAEDLLVIARGAEGELAVHPEPLAVRPALQGMCERFGDRASQQGRRMSIDAPEDLQVSADHLRIRQALGNLIDNALRHGGGEIVLGAHTADGGVALEVSDRGSGFSPEIAERAFERFARGDQARTRGGAGLGLAIVRVIAEAHRGHAEISSIERAAVRIWLPDGRTAPTAS